MIPVFECNAGNNMNGICRKMNPVLAITMGYIWHAYDSLKIATIIIASPLHVIAIPCHVPKLPPPLGWIDDAILRPFTQYFCHIRTMRG